jgi:hypothetical protein
MIHMGRYTSALLLIAVGVALIFDQTSGTRYLHMLVEWWPAVLILLGVEVILLSVIFSGRDTRFVFSFGSVFWSLLITSAVLVLTGFGEEKLDLKRLRLWEYASREIERPVERIAVSGGTETIRIINKNGNVAIRAGETDHIEVQSVLKIPGWIGDNGARKAEEEAALRITEGKTTEIEASGRQYRYLFWMFGTRIDMVITVPSGLDVSYELDLMNGDVSVYDSATSKRITIQTRNGDVDIRGVAGELQVTTRNGDIEVIDAGSDVVLSTDNGSISITKVSGDIEAETDNGDVEVSGIGSSLRVRTSNGHVTLVSPVVNGDWNVETSNGDIRLRIPEQGDYRLVGKGDAETKFSWLKVRRGEVEGQVGSGLHLIELRTRNGDLEIRDYGRFED